MSSKIKGAGKTASKSKPKNSSRNSRLNSRKRPFNVTKALLAVFVLVMLVWLAALMMIKEEPQEKKANLAQNNNTQKIHELLESKKKKSSVLDEQNSSQKISQKISKDNKISNIYEEISDEKLNEFSKKLQEQKEEFIAKTVIEQNSAKSEQNASKEQSTFEKTADQDYSYSANSHSKPKSHKVPNGGPKLAIIMDDISTNAQINELKKLSIKVTPSIFPPEKEHPKTAELAKEFSVYMVHLPLQALNYTNEKANTLRTGDSKEKISQRIKDIKKDFKGVKYINNHTGSDFTSDFKSTLALLAELKNSEIYFIDSLTTNKSTALDASKKLGLKYVYRDVFLDNEQQVSKTLKMINKAVAVAKKDGVAIAICHPYKSTFEALKIAQKNAFDGVEVVYVDKIYEHYK